MTSPGEGFDRLFRLDGKGFVILGAGQGIGAACSRALASCGAQVLCVDLDAGLARRQAEEVGGAWAAGDVTEEDSLLSLLDVAYSELDRVDGAIDIVGRATRRMIPDFDPQSWDQEFDLNLRHAYLLGRHLAPRLAAGGGGSLTFVTSAITQYGCHVTPAYHAAKAALQSWVKSLAVTFGPDGVRANAVAPGPTLTPRMADSWEADVRAAIQGLTALKEIADPADIAAAAAFLSSPAARMITGHTIVVDGGAAIRDPYYGDPRDARFDDDVR